MPTICWLAWVIWLQVYTSWHCFWKNICCVSPVLHAWVCGTPRSRLRGGRALVVVVFTNGPLPFVSLHPLWSQAQKLRSSGVCWRSGRRERRGQFMSTTNTLNISEERKRTLFEEKCKSVESAKKKKSNYNRTKEGCSEWHIYLLAKSEKHLFYFLGSQSWHSWYFFFSLQCIVHEHI